ncbi:MAG: hypothetical protein ACR652_11820 [Methylocystis sp.]|uniref:hypothetical protein n=1 Tax=Methylocystis sp. TaxID=1911079 RepID=UPI003DA29C0F
MRLVLVEHGSERVRGDSAVFAASSCVWAENAFLNVGVSKLSVVAARLFDESEGRLRWNYEYSPFGPLEKGEGYDIFACSHDLHEAPPVHFEDLANVFCECFYVGHVRCIPPVVSLQSHRSRRAEAEKARAAPLRMEQGSL